MVQATLNGLAKCEIKLSSQAEMYPRTTNSQQDDHFFPSDYPSLLRGLPPKLNAQR